MKSSLLAIVFVASVLASTAHARTGTSTTGVALLTPVTIDPASQIPDSVRDECRIDYQLEANILDAMRRYDPQVQTTKDASAGQVLQVAITYVLGTGGGSWTGPKVIAIHVDLLNDGKVAYSTKMHRRSGMGGFKGTCQLLDGASKGLGRMVAKWVQRPKTTVVDEEGEPEMPAASDAASAVQP